MSEQELVENETAELEAALSDAPAPVVEPEVEQPEQEKSQDRDENGRFKAKAEQPEPKQESTEGLPTNGHQLGADKPADMVPVWRLNEVSQSKREAAARAEAAERRAMEAERRIQEFEAQRKPAEPVQAPDMYQDPEGWQQYVIQQAEQRAQAQADAIVTRKLVERDLMRAKEQHGEVFDKAYAALEEQIGRGDHSARMRVLNSASPGEELVKWYKSNEFLREVGDPDTWRKQQEEAMRAKILEEIGKAPDRPKTKIPPSLSRATAANSPGEDSPPLSDRELHASIFS